MSSLTDEIACLSNNYNFNLDIDTLLNHSTTSRRAKRRTNQSPRPQNPFIIYRRDKAASSEFANLRLRSSEVSNRIANMWRTESNEVRELFYALARLSRSRLNRSWVRSSL